MTIENQRLPDQTHVDVQDTEILGDEADDEFSALGKPKLMVHFVQKTYHYRPLFLGCYRLQQDRNAHRNCFRSLEI
jgi:hypothetical protein